MVFAFLAIAFGTVFSTSTVYAIFGAVTFDTVLDARTIDVVFAARTDARTFDAFFAAVTCATSDAVFAARTIDAVFAARTIDAVFAARTIGAVFGAVASSMAIAILSDDGSSIFTCSNICLGHSIGREKKSTGHRKNRKHTFHNYLQKTKSR